MTRVEYDNLLAKLAKIDETMSSVLTIMTQVASIVTAATEEELTSTQIVQLREDLENLKIEVKALADEKEM